MHVDLRAVCFDKGGPEMRRREDQTAVRDHFSHERFRRSAGEHGWVIYVKNSHINDS